MKEVTIGKKTYTISDNKIQNGDYIYNEPSGSIDKCISIFSDSMMCVEFPKGMRAIFHKKHYKKAIIKP